MIVYGNGFSKNPPLNAANVPPTLPPTLADEIYNCISDIYPAGVVLVEL